MNFDFDSSYEERWIFIDLKRKACIFILLATLVMLSFAFKIQSWASSYQFDFWYDYLNEHYEQTLTFTGPYSIFDVQNGNGQSFLYAVSLEPFTYSDTRYNYVDETADKKNASSGEVVYMRTIVYHPDDDFVLAPIDIPILNADDFGTANYSLYLANNIHSLGFNNLPGVNGSSGGDNSCVYDSNIPAPQNLKFSSKQFGGIIKPLTIEHILSWTNALVDSYSVRVSVSGTYKDSEGSSFPFNLMMASDGSDGADAGVPASDGSVSFALSDIMKAITHKYPSEYMVKSVNPQEYRVQFYQYNSGELSVGPVGVISVTRNNSGIWVGTSSTVEYPVDKDNLGDSGGLYPSGDNWTSEGQGFQDYDSNGNLIGSGTVGDPDSYTPSDRPTQSIGDMLNSFFESLMNIPTLITQLFNSLRDAMSGIGELPAFLTQVVSWLPSEIVSLISLGIVVVVVLRIFGR